MGQLLLIQGGQAEQVRSLFAKAARAFRSICGSEPCDQSLTGNTAVAKFPMLLATTSGVVRDPQTGAWICSAGALFYSNSVGADALHGLLDRLQEPEGDSAFVDLDGIFAAAFHDGNAGRLKVVTDRLGTLHIYKAVIDSCLVVCTSSMVLAALLSPKWDLVSCREFLATGTVFEQRSLFQGIEKLAPATVYEFQCGRLVSHSRYWDLAAVMYDRAPFAGDVPGMATVLEGAFKLLSRSFKKPVLDLTGGFDSRALLGAMLKAGVNFDTVVNGSTDHPDVITSKQIASTLGLRHRHQIPRVTSAHEWWERAVAALPLCDGEYDILEYARTFDVQSRLAADFDATINGSNGELCKGYWWELLFPFTGRRDHFDERRVAAGRFAVGQEETLLDQAFSCDLVEHFAGVIHRANAGFEGHPNTASLDNVYLTLRMQRWNGRIASATSRLWPCVAPFMFRAAMETALSAPPSIRIRHRMTRRLIEHLNPVLSGIPLADGNPAMPLRWNSVHRFTPLIAQAMKAVYARAVKPEPLRGESSPEGVCLRTLCQMEVVANLMHPNAMITAGLYRQHALKDLLGLAAQGAKRAQFGRVLTLELLARAIRSGYDESRKPC